MSRVVFVDGVRSIDGLVALDPDDTGLLLGVTVFATMRTYARRVFAWDLHFARLAGSARAVGLALPGEGELLGCVKDGIEAFSGECGIRVTLTGGSAGRSGRWIVRIEALGPAPQTARVATRVWEPTAWLPGDVKHGSRLGSLLALRQAGTDEVLWVDQAGHLLEGTRSNVFAVIDGVLRTPPLDGRILAGVTRHHVILAAREAGVAVEQRSWAPQTKVDELYLSSTLRELCPVVALDGQLAPGGGPVGARVSAAFRSLVLR